LPVVDWTVMTFVSYRSPLPLVAATTSNKRNSRDFITPDDVVVHLWQKKNEINQLLKFSSEQKK
jgi:hypothetical protein